MSLDKGPLLTEAATYIDKFAGKVVVVKLGGELLDGGPVLQRLLPQLVTLYKCGLRPVVVHGGGVQVNRACEAKGVTFRKVHGRRITSPEVLSVLIDVVAGELNRNIVDALRASGVPAKGYAEGVSDAVRCTRRPPSEVDGELVDWGEVGDVDRVDGDALRSDGAWVIPVLPSVGTLDSGARVNVNADSVASKVAVDIGAEKLLLLTGVAGVLPSADSAGPISEMNAEGVREVMAGSAVKGGMRAKLEESLRALAGGVARVHILSGRERFTILREIFTAEGCGTLIVP